MYCTLPVLLISPLDTPRRRTDDNIKIDFKDTGYGCVNWIYLAQDRGSGGIKQTGQRNMGFNKIR
jgi:hypothetical protein